MTSVLYFCSGGPGAPSLGSDLEGVGLSVAGALGRRTLVQDVIRAGPDVVVCYESHPDDAFFSAMAALQEAAPLPFVLFTSDPDADKIERAAAAGAHAYVVNGYAPGRLRPVIHVAQARFRRDRALREELAEVRDRFAERKLVDRAKGILMRVRDVPEEEAFRALRSAAMQSKQRIGQVAQQVIDATRYADAVNRAGQLRMLSQRIVKLHALRCAATAGDAESLCRDSVGQVEANLLALGRALSKPTFGDLLDGVLVPWAALKAAVGGRPDPARLREVDALAERLLAQAEALTRNLETAGFAAALRVINVSGRQRMLSQRIAKAAALSRLLGPSPAGEAEMRRAEAEFEQGLAFLDATPLSTPEIAAAKAAALRSWAAFRIALGRPSGAEAAALSEELLERFGALTALYEQGIQALMA